MNNYTPTIRIPIDDLQIVSAITAHAVARLALQAWRWFVALCEEIAG
jgi:hypothetical protein